jgi:hypothetical protein
MLEKNQKAFRHLRLTIRRDLGDLGAAAPPSAASARGPSQNPNLENPSPSIDPKKYLGGRFLGTGGEKGQL